MGLKMKEQDIQQEITRLVRDRFAHRQPSHIYIGWDSNTVWARLDGLGQLTYMGDLVDMLDEAALLKTIT